MKRVLIGLFFLSCALSAGAVTITNSFDPMAPFTRVTSPGSDSLYFVDPRGFLRCSVQRRNEPNGVFFTNGGYNYIRPSVGYYYVPLDQRYYMPANADGVATTGDYYVGFDFKIDPASTTISAAQIGLFNSDSNNIDLNKQAPLFSALNSVAVIPWDCNKVALESQTNNDAAANSYVQTQYNIPVEDVNVVGPTSYRIKMHLHFSGGQTLADLDTYSIDAIGNTVLKGHVADIVISDTGKQLKGMNALGIRNAYGLSKNSKSIFWVDNMYFSTESHQSMPAPSWLAPTDPNTYAIGAVTYTQKFRPWMGTWKTGGQGGGTYIGASRDNPYPDDITLNPCDDKGYFFTRSRRKGEYDYSAAFYQPLAKRLYLPFDDAADPNRGLSKYTFRSCNEFWMGYDWKWVSGSAAATSFTGLFNSKSVNCSLPNRSSDIPPKPNLSQYEYQNHLGVNSHYAAAPYGEISITARGGGFGTPKDYGLNSGNPVVNQYIGDVGKWQRILMHYYLVGGVAKLRIQSFPFDDAGVVSTTPEVDWVADVNSSMMGSSGEGFDAFGFRNTSSSTHGDNTRQDYQMDNAYFSTVGPQDLGKPSWFALNGADGNIDGVVDFKDLKSFASDWLSTTNLFWDYPYDKQHSSVGDGTVNFVDLARFAGYWVH